MLVLSSSLEHTICNLNSALGSGIIVGIIGEECRNNRINTGESRYRIMGNF